LRSIETGLSIAETTGETWCAAELLRLRAVARAGHDAADPRVEADLGHARRVAHEQGAVAWLRAIDQAVVRLGTM
jgi:hypothetical protein